MSMDLNNLISQPQSNAVSVIPSTDKDKSLIAAPIDSAPVLQQPLSADTFNTEISKNDTKTNKILDQILKYAGLAALVVSTVALLLSHKNRNVSTDGVATTVSEPSNKLATQVKEVVDKNTTISGYIDNIRTVLVHSAGIDIYTNKAVQTVKLK